MTEKTTMTDTDKTLTGRPKEEFHVKIGKTDYEISEARLRELSFTGHALSRDEIAGNSSPEPFGV